MICQSVKGGEPCLFVCKQTNKQCFLVGLFVCLFVCVFGWLLFATRPTVICQSVKGGEGLPNLGAAIFLLVNYLFVVCLFFACLFVCWLVGWLVGWLEQGNKTDNHVQWSSMPN